MSAPTSAGGALDDIREGGQQLLLNVYSRLHACEMCVQDGKFEEALGHAAQISERIAHLYHAQHHLGALAGAMIVKAEDLTVGMAYHDSRIVAIVECDCPVPECQKKIVHFESGAEMPVVPGMDVAVTRE